MTRKPKIRIVSLDYLPRLNKPFVLGKSININEPIRSQSDPNSRGVLKLTGLFIFDDRLILGQPNKELMFNNTNRDVNGLIYDKIFFFRERISDFTIKVAYVTNSRHHIAALAIIELLEVRGVPIDYEHLFFLTVHKNICDYTAAAVADHLVYRFIINMRGRLIYSDEINDYKLLVLNALETLSM